jgi:signal transduction histidine kinase
VREALSGQSGATYQQAGDSEHVVAYSPVVPLGWGLVSEEPWEMVDTPRLRTTQAAPLVLIPVLLLTLVALWFTVSQIVRPLQQLGTKSAQLAQGNFRAIEEPVGGITEIQQLQTGLIHMAQAVRAAQQNLHHYIGAITSAQEEERRRLARELHDDTIQGLIALKQRVYLTRMKLETGAANGSLDEIAGLTEQTIENLRRVTRALRPIYLEDLGLATALEMLARETGQSSGLAVTFHSEGEQRRLTAETELSLYRMAQEALNNAARHAQAQNASVRIAFTPQAVTLEVSDDGQGFRVPVSPAEFAPAGHYGLLGLYERAELIGARLEIQSKPGEGTRVRVTV